jgi:hypothetical protein
VTIVASLDPAGYDKDTTLTPFGFLSISTIGICILPKGFLPCRVTTLSYILESVQGATSIWSVILTSAILKDDQMPVPSVASRTFSDMLKSQINNYREHEL